MIILPDYIDAVIKNIESHGHEAFAVGGCVRDSLIGRQASDWDIATSALPEEIISFFGEKNVIPTGIRHGTVTVKLGKNTAEVTTYRIEGDYADHRRPSAVTFTSDLRRDLARRDFTVNAVAYNPRTGITDPFGGRADMEKRVIRCVGNPAERFREDALRIMRALRFSAVLGFDIADSASAALTESKHLLNNIAAERISAELNKLMLANDPAPVLRKYSDVISVFIPEIMPCIGFDTGSKNHIYDVWEHVLHAVSSSPPILPVRLALLFHDIAKPACAVRDATGRFHFTSHQIQSAECAGRIMRRLKYDNRTRVTVKQLIENHDTPIAPTSADVKKALNRFGEENFKMLIYVKLSDNLAKTPECRYAREAHDLLKITEETIERGECYKLSQLAVNGSDIQNALGVDGKRTGYLLNTLLNLVIEEECANDKASLLEIAKNLI